MYLSEWKISAFNSDETKMLLESVESSCSYSATFIFVMIDVYVYVCEDEKEGLVYW